MAAKKRVWKVPPVREDVAQAYRDFVVTTKTLRSEIRTLTKQLKQSAARR